MQQDRKGNIWWIGEGRLGQFKEGSFSPHTLLDGFIAASSSSFHEDREGNLWIGSINGLYRVREAAIAVFTRQHGLSSDNVYSIYEDRAGQLWFGAWSGGGVTKFKDGCTAHYRRKEAPFWNFVTTLYEGPDGYLWIGTTHKLYRLNPAVLSDCHPHYLDERSAYPDPMVYLPRESGTSSTTGPGAFGSPRAKG